MDIIVFEQLEKKANIAEFFLKETPTKNTKLLSFLRYQTLKVSKRNIHCKDNFENVLH